jgi:hypothetical protein
MRTSALRKIYSPVMAHWEPIRPISVGGLVAVGFLDEYRIVIGSHSGLGVLDARDGTLLARVEDPDGDYNWLRGSPPMGAYTDGEGEHLVEVAGVWGGSLPETTDDGWTCGPATAGAVLSGPDGVEFRVDDDEAPRACGFSPQGRVFVFATSATLHVSVRSTP